MSTGAPTTRERAVGLIAAFRGIHWDEERAIDVAANTLTAHAAAAVEQRDREWCEALMLPRVPIEVRAVILAHVNGGPLKWSQAQVDEIKREGERLYRLFTGQPARTPTTPEPSQ